MAPMSAMTRTQSPTETRGLCRRTPRRAMGIGPGPARARAATRTAAKPIRMRQTTPTSRAPRKRGARSLTVRPSCPVAAQPHSLSSRTASLFRTLTLCLRVPTACVYCRRSVSQENFPKVPGQLAGAGVDYCHGRGLQQRRAQWHACGRPLLGWGDKTSVWLIIFIWAATAYDMRPRM